LKVREHFLLGTEHATVSVTAKADCNRQTLFHRAIEMILARYQEEFGLAAYRVLVESLQSSARQEINWRLRPEDSCWSRMNE